MVIEFAKLPVAIYQCNMFARLLKGFTNEIPNIFSCVFYLMYTNFEVTYSFKTVRYSFPFKSIHKALHRLVFIGFFARLAAEQTEEAFAKPAKDSADEKHGDSQPLPDDSSHREVIQIGWTIVPAALAVVLDVVPDVEDPNGSNHEPGNDQGEGNEIEQSGAGEFAYMVDGVTALVVLPDFGHLATAFLKRMTCTFALSKLKNNLP